MPAPYMIVDAHQDIAWNMQTFNRDYLRNLEETRKLEAGTIAPKHIDDTLLGWDAYIEGQVGIIFATLFACPIRKSEGVWDKVCYGTPEEARQLYRSQLDTYERMLNDHADKYRLLKSGQDIESHLSDIEFSESNYQLGLVLLMEGSEGILDIDELEEWWQRGVRIIGPAWAGNQYCGGTSEPGGFSKAGFGLLEGMADLGFILDISHLDQLGAREAIDLYEGQIIATHSNAATLVRDRDTNRHLTDEVINGIIEREGVIGVVLYNPFLLAGLKKGDARDPVQLEHVITQIDYICQMAGNAQHCGIGSDFDGGFGLQSVPTGINSIADLKKLGGLLAEKGYEDEDISAIFGGNWTRMLKSAFPERP